MNSIVVTSTKQNIKFGYEGEDNVTKIIFPYDESWLEYGEGNFEVRILRCGDEVAYTATEVVDDRQAMTLTMTVTDIELSVRGRGEMQLCYVCPDSIKKSPIYQYTVNRSVDYKYAVDPPEGSIIASVEKSLSEIKNTTNRLSNSVISIESSIDDVNSQIDNINDKISEFDEEIDSIGEVETRVDNLETSIQSINGRINTAEGNINENTESISDLNESVTELENRKVTDLETSGGKSDSGKYLTVGTDGKIKATSLTIPPTITVDTSLSATSQNPVQNKVIKTELNNINSNIETCNTEISKINGSLENIYIHRDFTSDFVYGKFVYANVSKGSTLNIENLQSNSTFCYLIIPVHAGYVYEFIATTESGTSKRAYVLTDSNYVVVAFGDNGKSYTNGKIIPSQDGYLVINAKKEKAHSCTETYYPTGNRISALEEIVNDIEDIPDTVNGLIPSYGVPFTPAIPYKYVGENIVPYKASGHLADIYALYDALLAQYPQYMHKQILGMDASEQYELRAYYVDNGTNYAYRLPRMVWLASIHGNEGNTTISAYNMLKELLEKFTTEPVCYGIMSAVRLYVIPAVNPWGVENYSRLNSNNVNLNRNFPADWVYRDPELASGTEKYGIMSASNGSNKYYYYGGGTCVYDDTTQTATATYVAEPETQIIMDFLNSINTGSNLHGKVCFAVNKHDAGSMSEEGATIFIKDNYPSDRAFLSNLIDWFKPLLMGTQNWLTEKSGLNIGTVSYSAHGDAGSAGTMDKWYNAIGIHGCLCEIPKDAGSSFADTQHHSDLCAINVEFGLNLLANVIVNNAKLKDNTQTEHYEIVT